MAKRKRPPGWKPKEKSPPKPPTYGVYFDESERIHQPSGQSQFVFTAALLRDSRKAELEEKYLALRQEMTTAVLAVVPHLENHSSIRSGLLEIHAVDLYQSKGIYREVNRIQPDFWKRQHQWLEQALAHASASGVKYFSVPADSEGYEQQVVEIRRSLFSNEALTKYHSVQERITKMISNPYFLAFPFLLHEIDGYLRQTKGESKIYCHTNDDAKGFSEIKTLAQIKEYGHLVTLSTPEFRTCSQEQAIQTADVAGYVLLQIAYAKQFQTNLKPEFARWFPKYIHPHVDYTERPKASNWQNILSIIVLETYLQSAKGPLEHRKVLEGLVDIAKMYVLEPDKFAKAQAWLKSTQKLLGSLAELSQMNKPPAEAEDLYADRIPDQAGEVNNE